MPNNKPVLDCITMKALITGASGFIGSHLAETLLGRGHEVHCLARAQSRLPYLERAGARIIRASFEDEAALTQATRGMGWVFHLAAVINAPSWKEYHRVNTLYTARLLAACEKSAESIQRFVYVSSVSAAGDSGPTRYPDESCPCNPDDWYGKSKLGGEAAVLSCGSRFPITILRPPFVIGPGQKELLMIIRVLKAGIRMTMGNGSRQSILIYVSDLVEAMIRCAENPAAAGKTYFVSDERLDGYSWKELLATISSVIGRRRFWLSVPVSVQLAFADIAERCAALIGSASPITRDYVLKVRDSHWLYDASAIRRDIGFKARYSLRQGIEKIMANGK